MQGGNDILLLYRKTSFCDFRKSNKSLHFMNFVIFFLLSKESHLLDEILHGTKREEKRNNY